MSLSLTGDAPLDTTEAEHPVLDVVDTLAGFEVHEAANMFPLIQGAAFESFVNDIATNGQMEPAVIDQQGRLLDGRNRARACEHLGITVKVRTYDGADPVAFVVSHNLHRRHLTDSQRAMIAGRLATRATGHRDRATDGSGGSYEPPAPKRSDAASLLNVSVSAVQKAKIVLRNGTDALAALVADGHSPVTTAARVADLSADEQDAYAEKVRAGADPVETAPPDLKQKAWHKRRKEEAPPKPARPPSEYGNRRRHAAQLDALVVALDGATSAFHGVAHLDVSVNEEEATRLTGDLSKQIRSLNRILSLIKERTP